MANQADEIQRIENVDEKNNPGYEKQGQLEKQNVVTIDAAENEGLPVVGLRDEKPKQPDKAKAVVAKSAANNGLLPVLHSMDTS